MDKITEKNENYMIVQSVVFIVIIIAVVNVALLLINETVKSIINPISDLAEVVKSLANDDTDADVTKNFEPNSKEICQLYNSFTKLKYIMKYANKEFLSGNDAQALINYANALNLYLELNHKEGVGITYNNIGNIHFKNERFEEAISCYRLAVQTVEDELNETHKKNHHQQALSISKISDPSDLESQNITKIFLPKSRRRLDKRDSEVSEKISPEKIKQLNEMYSNRIYQLATTLYNLEQSKSIIDPARIQEVISLLNKVIEIDSHNKFDNSRIIQSLIYIANCYLLNKDHVACLKYLKEAENSLCIYEKIEKLLPHRESGMRQKEKSVRNKNDEEKMKKYEGYLDKFQGKADILKQTLIHHYGIFYKRVGKYKQACIMFTQSIEMGKIYDPHIRKMSLEALSNLLASQNLLQKAPNITKILTRMDSINHKDIIFLLDYSESMGEGARIQYAIKNFVKIYDKYIQDEDKIGFIRFNLNCEIVFALTYKKNNTLQLRMQIENSVNPFGKTAFFDALGTALKQFSLEKGKHEENRAKWIVSLTDGEDNFSQLTCNKIKKLLKDSDVNLIVVGMGLSKTLVLELKSLCKSTKDGVFIESPNTNDLDVAFAALSKIIYGQNVIIETV